jgi:HEAT repeat protein
VIWALGELRDKKAVEQLIGTLKNRLPAVRISTSRALGKIRDNRAVMPLLEALENETAWEVKNSILWALGEIRDNRSIPALINALRDASYYVRLHAENALEKTGCKAVPLLIPAVNDETYVARTRAVWTLEKITGQNYGRDTAGWKKWLSENEGCSLINK